LSIITATARCLFSSSIFSPVKGANCSSSSLFCGELSSCPQALIITTLAKRRTMLHTYERFIYPPTTPLTHIRRDNYFSFQDIDDPHWTDSNIRQMSR